jgi:hypothetical protein
VSLIRRLPADAWLWAEQDAAEKAALKPTEEKIRDRAAHYAELARQQEEVAPPNPGVDQQLTLNIIDLEHSSGIRPIGEYPDHCGACLAVSQTKPTEEAE